MDYKQVDFKTFAADYFPEMVGVEAIQVTKHLAIGRMEVKKSLFAPNGYLHAGSIITLADTMAGFGCLYNLPLNAISFTTIEFKANFIGAAKNGYIKAEAVLQHGGKTTQVWDVTVKSEENEKTIALFRCTQLILYS